MININVPSGTVQATHRHPSYGPCVILRPIGHSTAIRTSRGTAFVPRNTLYPINPTK